ncbi:hypothetical protein KKC52_13485 [bacterium]|nr:hypothetical protein [bacterium]
MKKDVMLNVIITPEGVDRVQIYGKNKDEGLKILKLIEKRIESINKVLRKSEDVKVSGREV